MRHPPTTRPPYDQQGLMEGPERLLLSWERPRKKVGPWAAGVQRGQSPVCTGVGEVVKVLKHPYPGTESCCCPEDAVRFAAGRMEP